MAVNWRRHFNALYARLGVAGTLTIPGTDGGEYAIRVIDTTVGIAVGDGVQVATIKPACDVRAREFFGHGLERADLEGASITFNGKTLDIEHPEMRPCPSGEAEGEIRLFLSEQDD